MRKVSLFTILLMCIFCLAACGRSMNDVIGKEPDFAGIVEAVYDGYLVIRINENEVEYENCPLVQVPLDVEIKDSYLACEVGDEVVVYYDGTIVEGEPTLVQKVYAITLRTPSNREAEQEEEDKSAETLILKVNDTLYYGTDETGPMGDADAVDGYIEASVGVDEIPEENGESNFGCVGNPYTKDFGDGWIMVFMDDEEYHIFYRKSQEEEKWAMTPMVMVDGELYLTTGYESTTEARCGMMDGEITSSVESWEIPTEDNQSNFGSGYGYQYGAKEGTIEIYMNEKWWIYAKE